MVKVLTKYNISKILECPQNYVNENIKEDLISVNGTIITLVYDSECRTPYYFKVRDDDGMFDAYYPGYSLSEAYDKLLVGILEDVEDFSGMPYSEFSKYLCNNSDRFYIILDYDWDFFVYKDMKTKKYYYFETLANGASVSLEVYPVAVLEYTVMHDVQSEDGDELEELFDNFVCGEEVTDDGIRYWWFGREENNV